MGVGHVHWPSRVEFSSDVPPGEKIVGSDIPSESLHPPRVGGLMAGRKAGCGKVGVERTEESGY